MKEILGIIFFISITQVRAQILDSLASMSNNDVYSLAVGSWRTDDDFNQTYLVALKENARKTNDNLSKLRYYHIEGLIGSDSISNLFADSIISIAKNISKTNFLAAGYFLKGRNFYRSRNYKKSLDNFILTNDILEKTGDSITLNYLVKDNIGLIRLLIGENEEAIDLYEELLVYYKNQKREENYMYTLFNIGVAHHQAGNFFKSQDYINEGLKYAKKNNSEGYSYLLSVYGANQYALGNYQIAIDSLKKCISFFHDLGDYTNESISYYYMGMSYKELGDIEESKKKLKKLDSIFQNTLDIYPLTRNGWETLIDYARIEKDSESELYYIQSLLKVDSVINDDYKYVNSKFVQKI